MAKHLTVLMMAILGLTALSQESQAAAVPITCPAFDDASSVAISSTTDTCITGGSLAGPGIVVSNSLKDSARRYLQFLIIANGNLIDPSITCVGSGCGTFVNSRYSCQASVGAGPCSISFSYTDEIGLVSSSFDVANNTTIVRNFTVTGGAFTPDTTNPAVAITGVPATTDGSTPFTATFTFDEDVTGFDAASDISVANGAASMFAATTPNRVFTATITPNGAGDTSVSVLANTAQDGASNGNDASSVATATLSTPPGVPTNVQFDAFDISTPTWIMSWDAPASDGGSAITTYPYSIHRDAVCGTSLGGGTFNVSPSFELSPNIPLAIGLGASHVSIKISARNANGDSAFSTCVSRSVDEVRPTVESVTRGFAGAGQIPETTDEDIVSWFVKFSENITRPVASDFAITGTTSNVTISEVNPDEYEISLSGGDLATLNGTVTFNFAAGQTIQDTAGNALVNITPSGANNNMFIMANDTPPDAPSGLSVVSAINPNPADNSKSLVSLSWSLSADDGGSAITQQDVTIYADEFCAIPVYTGAVGIPTATSAELGLNLTDFSVGAKPSFTIQAVNAEGSSDPSNCVSATIPVADTTAPVLTVGISSNNANAAQAKAGDEITVAIVADEPLASAPAVTIAGETATVSGSGTSWSAVLTVGAATTEGSAAINITAYQDIHGNTGAAVTAVTNASAVNVDRTAPLLTGIFRPGIPLNTNVDSVGWQFTFDEAVQNVSMDDYSVTGTTATVTSLHAASSSFYAITVEGGDLDNLYGTISVGFAAGQDIQDLAGNTLSNTTSTGRNDNQYNISNRSPEIASITRVDASTQAPVGSLTNADELAWNLTFSSISNQFALYPADFTLSGSTADVFITRYSIGFIVRTLGGDLASLDGDVTLGFSGTSPTDEFGNVFTNKTPSGVSELTYTLDNTAPRISSIDLFPGQVSPTDDDSISWSVQFSEDVTLDSNGADFTFSGLSPDSKSASHITDSHYEVSAANGDLINFNGNVTLNVAPGQTITDKAGNALVNSIVTGTNNNRIQLVNDTTAPTLTAVSIASNNADDSQAKDGDIITVSITSNEALGTAPVVTIFGGGTTVTGSGTSWSAVSAVDGTSPEGNAAINISGFKDVAGNTGVTVSATTDSSAVNVDRTAPGLQSVLRSSPLKEYTNADSVVFAFTFTEPMINISTADFNDTSGIPGDTRPASVSTTSGSSVNVTFSRPEMANANRSFSVSARASQTMTDAAGNPLTVIAPATTAEFYRLDNIAPILDSITRFAPADETTDSDTLYWAVQFSEGITDLNPAGITITGTTANVSPSIPHLSSRINVRLSGGDLQDLNDTVTFAFAPGHGLKDYAGNPWVTAAPTGVNEVSYNVVNDTAAPTLTSILRKTPAGENTNADSLTWAVTFDEDIQNLDGADFALSGTTAGLSVSGSGSVYDVTATGGDLAGLNSGLNGQPVSLGLAAGQNIQDTAGNALTDIAATGATESYNVNNGDLTIASITRVDSTTQAAAAQLTNADTLAWNLQFSGITGAFALAPADFTLTGTTASIISVDRYSIGFIVRASGGDLAGLDGTVTLGFSGTSPTDEFGNVFTNKTPSGVSEVTYTLDNTAPTLVSILPDVGTVSPTDADTVSFIFTYSEDLDLSSLNVSNGLVTGTTANVTLTPISASVARVTLSGGDLADLNGTVTASLNPANNIADPAGNLLASVTPTGTNNNAVVVQNDVTAPTLTAVSIASNNAITSKAKDGDTITVSITSDEALDTPPVVTIYGGGTTVTGAGTSWSAVSTVDGTSPEGTAAINISGFRDAAGNTGTAVTGTTNGTAVEVDRTAPILRDIGRFDPGTEQTDSDTLYWRVEFDEPIANFSQSDIVISGTTAALNAFHRDADSNTIHVQLSGGDLPDLNGRVSLAFSPGQGITDEAGNAWVLAAPTGSNAPFYTLVNDAIAPTLVSISRVAPATSPTDADSLMWMFEFSEIVTAPAATDFTITGTSASVTYIGDAGGPGPALSYGVTISGGDLADLDGVVSITLNGSNQVSDLAGNDLTNPAASGTNDNSYTVDNAAPTTTASTPPASVNGPFDITFTFTEDMTGLTASDFTVAHATVVVSGGPKIFTVTITPDGTGNISVDLPADVAFDAAGNGNEAFSATINVDFDNTAPSVTASAVAAIVNGAFDVTFTFSEDVSGFEASDLTLVNATAAVSGGPSIYTATITPTGGDVSVFVPADAATDAAGNGNTALSAAVTTSFDTTAPTVTASSPPVSVNGPFDLTFTFSEDVSGFEASDLVLTNATATLSGGPLVYTATITPTGGDVSVSVPAGAATDAAGNANTALAAPVTGVEFDTTPPSVTASTPPASVNGPFDLTFTFTEDMTGLTASDFTVANGTVVVSGGPKVFTVTITPDGNGDVSVSLPANSATDAAGNGNEAFNAVITVDYDTTAPAVTVSSPPASVNGPFDLTFTFSEEVSGFEASDLTLTNATATLSGGPSIYTATITPTGGDVSVSVPANAATDAAGNANTALAAPVTGVGFDTTPPSVTASMPPASVNGPFDLTFTFTEDMTGLTASDFTVANGTVVVTGGPKVFTVTITPDGNGDVSVSLPADAATDAAGNGNAAFNAVITVDYDTTAPTVTASAAPASVNGLFDLTFTFSEDVSGFDAADLTLTNATATLSGGPKAYTVTLTPDGNGDVSVSLPANSAADAAGNGNEAFSTIITVDYDVTPPTVDPVEPPSAVNGEFELTYRFSEDMTGLEASDFIVTNATVTLSGGPREFVLTVTPTETGDISIELPANVATDPAGNGNEAQTVEVKIELDKEPPTLTITAPLETQNDPFTATFTFSENVIGFDQSDIILTNASLSNFQSSNKFQVKSGGSSHQAAGGGTVYTALITPSGEGQVTITVLQSALGDAAGNLNVNQVAIAVIIDTVSPDVTIAELPADVRGPFTVTVNFDEAVTGFELSDVVVVNGSGSDFQSVNTRQYTFVVTPLQMGQVTIDIPAGVATDAAGNTNTAALTASTEFIDEVFVSARTSRIIHNFMARRADQITLSSPDLSKRLLSKNTGGQLSGSADHKHANLSFKGSASGDRARLDKFVGANAASKINLWTEASLVSASAKTTDNDLFLLHAGVDYKVSEDTLVGVMAQYDYTNEEDRTQDFEISGKGWMAGPYVVSRLTDKLVFDGQASLGQSTNEVSPFNSYTDEFSTNRWLLKGQFTGDFQVDDWNFNPNIGLTYFKETQKTYVDSYGIDIPEQAITLGRFTFGPRISKTFETQNKTTLSPNISVRGIWDFEQAEILDLGTGQANGIGALRARTEFGLDVGFSSGTRLMIDGFYDGVGAKDYEAYGLKAGMSFILK